MRVEKQVTKLTRMHTEMRIAVSVVRDIKQMLYRRENIATKKTRVKLLFCFVIELIYPCQKSFFSVGFASTVSFFIPGYHNNRVRVSDII